MKKSFCASINKRPSPRLHVSPPKCTRAPVRLQAQLRASEPVAPGPDVKNRTIGCAPRLESARIVHNSSIAARAIEKVPTACAGPPTNAELPSPCACGAQRAASAWTDLASADTPVRQFSEAWLCGAAGQAAEHRRYGLRLAYSEPTSIRSTLFGRIIRFSAALSFAFPARFVHRRRAA